MRMYIFEFPLSLVKLLRRAQKALNDFSFAKREREGESEKKNKEIDRTAIKRKQKEKLDNQ